LNSGDGKNIGRHRLDLKDIMKDAIATLRSQYATRRLVRQRSRQLEEELASYNTPAQRLELDAILGRHPQDQVAELEELLNRPALVRPSHL
jgi:hypothetical protein